MNEAQPIPKTVAGKIAQLMEAVGRIKATGYNSHFGYKFVQESYLADKVRRAMIKIGIIMIMDPQEIEIGEAGSKGFRVTTLKGQAHWIDTDNGDTLTVGFFGQGYDNQDKGIYKALTGAEKYILMKTLLIPTGDDPERSEGVPGPQTGPDPLPDERRPATVGPRREPAKRGPGRPPLPMRKRKVQGRVIEGMNRADLMKLGIWAMDKGNQEVYDATQEVLAERSQDEADKAPDLSQPALFEKPPAVLSEPGPDDYPGEL